MRDYDPILLKQQDPELYFRKRLEYDFWNNKPMERELCKQYIDIIPIEADLRAYLHRMILHHDQQTIYTH